MDDNAGAYGTKVNGITEVTFSVTFDGNTDTLTVIDEGNSFSIKNSNGDYVLEKGKEPDWLKDTHSAKKQNKKISK